MRILAFDTATSATTVALSDAEAGLELELRDDPPVGERPRHATWLLPMIADLLERSGGWAPVARIAVGTGPGSFTGLRIGIATARALAWARTVPLVGVSSLHALALGAMTPMAAPDGRAVLAAIDARRGEVFVAAWRGAERELDPCVLAPGELAAAVGRLTARDRAAPLAIGDGALRFRAQLEAARAEVPPERSALHRISAINHCRLAGGLPATSPTEVEPVYLRPPDAEIARREPHPGPK